MQISRLFEIIYILLDKKAVTAAELAEHFEVSRRTVYRDVETLCQAGIPICTRKGAGGGLSLPERFVLSKSYLSKQEQNEILAALGSLKAADYPTSGEILSRLSALFGVRNADWIDVDFSDWSPERKDLFTLLRTAVIEKRPVTFDYFGTNGKKTTRTADPLRLSFKHRAWYLIAYCHLRQSVRLFKLPRMKNISLSDGHFERDFSDQPFVEPDQQMFPIVTVSMRIGSQMAYRVWEEFEERQITRTADGFIVTMTYPEDEWVYGYLLSFGPSAEVLSPPHVRASIAERLKSMVEIY